MEIRVKKLSPEARLPTRGTEGSACFDVYCLEDTYLCSWETVLVKTGLAVEVPLGHFLDIRPRSGLALSGLTVNNSPGTLDSDYRGELLVMLHNQWDIGKWVRAGDRIAQIGLVKALDAQFIEVEELSDTKRGQGGFGSTGK